MGYELVLIAVAIAFPVAAQAVIRSRARLADRLLAGERLTGLDGLAVVLGRVLGDHSVQVFRWHSPDVGYVDEGGRQVPTGGGDRRWLTVDEPDGHVAVVAHQSPALDDPPTADAVAAAVRLAVTHLRLQEEQRQQLAELEASRARLVAAADRERERAATQLRQDVGVSLQLAQSELTAVRPATRDPAVAGSLDVVVTELATARDEIVELVAGVPPAQLGRGRLRDALDAVAQRSPVPVSVTVDRRRGRRRGHRDSASSTSARRPWPTRSNTPTRTGSTSPYGESTARCMAIISDDGHGGADPSGRGCKGSPTGWQR